MKRILTIVLAAAFLAVSTIISCNRQTTLSTHTLFETESTDTVPYRIPAIATLSDGSLLALTDYRYCKGDIGFGRVEK